MSKTVKKCGYIDCDRVAIKRGYCDKHYHAAIREGLIITNPRMNVGGTPSKHPLYRCWASMKNRCFNKNDYKNYELYGARGITVCHRWTGENGFWNFVKDMGDRPTGYSLDRINPDGDYSPDNCRWATPEQQSYNKRSNLVFVIDGKEYNTKQAASILGQDAEELRRHRRQSMKRKEQML